MTKFKLEITPSGKRIYLHIENGKKREEKIRECMMGKITQQEMRASAKKLKFHFKQHQLPEDAEIIN